MHSKSNNIEFTLFNNANEVANELFESLRSWYQGNFERSMEGSEFIFYFVQLMYYRWYKLNFRHGGSYTGSLDWIKKKQATINPKNKDDNKCF